MISPTFLTDICACPYINLHLKRLAGRFEKRTRRAQALQLDILAELIRLNGGSGFGQAHGLAKGLGSYKEFARRVPVCDYETYRPYVERMARGQNEALLGKGAKPLMFALTSGTEGKPKKIPATDMFLRNIRRGWSLLISRLWKDHGDLWYRQIFQLTSPPDDYVTASGVPCGSISGMTIQMQNWIAHSYFAVPQEVCYIKDTGDRYYAASRIAAEKDLGLIVTPSPATLIGVARNIQERTEQLLRDIREGTLTIGGEIGAQLRASLSRRLKPNPKLARELEKRVGSEGLLPKDVWKVAVIGCWLGGTMGLHIPKLRELYGQVSLRDIGLLASEGRMNIPLTDETPAGVLDIDNNFYEFVPVDEIDNWSGPALLAEELEVGQKYFILLSTPSGFFRYNISDMVEVTGYMGQAPVIGFLNKGTRISSLVGEKISEHNVVQAMAKVCKSMRREGQYDQMVLCPQWGDPPFYQLNIDAGAFDGLDVKSQVAELAAAFDQAMVGLNIEYKSKRKTKRLGPVQLRLLARGYLAECDREKMARSVTARSQFKHRFLHTELGADKDFPVIDGPKEQKAGL